MASLEGSSENLNDTFGLQSDDYILPYDEPVLSLTDLKTIDLQTWQSLAIGRKFIKLCQARNISAGMIGGLACDVHCGKFTRRHADIDIAFLEKDIDTIISIVKTNIGEYTAIPSSNPNIVRIEFPLAASDAVYNMDLFILYCDDSSQAFFNTQSHFGNISLGDSQELFIESNFRSTVLNLNGMIAFKTIDAAVRITKGGYDLALLKSLQ